ncbi:MAG: hypothetical protein KBD46_00395 [Candidatus Levybacteria bacterium]|nr:hypothetical protein [Candidatus Levybacteria bacterium]
MIKLLQEGKYKLLETKKQTKILTLDKKETFAWINALDIGEILVVSHTAHSVDCILSIGNYRMYEVKDESAFVDLVHLELFVGDGVWQGYLLPTGLPTDEKKRNRIIPTNETITKSTH